MEYRPLRSFIILMSVLTACGVAGAWGWNRMNSVPQEVRAKANLWKILTYKRPSVFEPPTPAEVARVKGEVDKMKAELVATHPLLAIADARNKSPLPLRSILLGGYLTRCDSLQLYLQRELEKRHPLSLLKGTARPGDMPVQGEESAPPLGPLALQVLKKSPDLKEIEKALEATGHRIKDITWDDFETVGATGRMGFKGNVTVLVEPAMAK